MISLKKYIDANWQETLDSALAAYRSSLDAMGTSGVEACPPVGASLRESLLGLQQRLAGDATPAEVDQTGQQVRAELDQWGHAAAAYYQQKTAELKEIMLILARAGEVIGERDQRYARQLHDFTGRLKAISNLQDLSKIRESLVTSASDLKSCAEKMVQESQAATTQMRQDVNRYQARLDEAERIASTDALTKLDSRRRVEESIQFRISRNTCFSILLLDLNRFKAVNDDYGHLAGDQVLKQFAGELKSAFRATDIVGRWGGDEFVVVLDCNLEEAARYIERLRKWVFGDYTIQAKGEQRKVHVEAAISAAMWQTGETMAALIDRADTSMYQQKAATACAAGRQACNAGGARS